MTLHTIKIHRSSNGPTRRKRMLTTRATEFAENISSNRKAGLISLLNLMLQHEPIVLTLHYES